MKTRRWQDIVNLLLGGWLFISPYVMGYMETEGTTNAMWNAYVAGALTMLFAAVAVYLPRAWEEWANMALGVWMIISPWVLAFAAHANIALNAVVVGLVVTTMATWAMFRDVGFEKWWHDHHVAS